jgi:uncharacterized protein YndB with AHSA1/START domain
MTMTATAFTIAPATQDVVLTRVFDAPRELVYKACTDPDLVAKWWGPRSLTTEVAKMEARPGGSWRFVQRDSAGNEFAFHGVYHDVVPTERSVSTFEFEGVPGHVALETTTYEDLGGKTRLTTQTVFQTVEDRDGMVKSGMESGATESMDRLAELLETLN